MSSKTLEDQLRMLMECKVCYEEKEYQKQLPCQHTLCIGCLDQLVVSDSRYKCPICIKEHLVPNGGFQALPESLVTKQLAALINSAAMVSRTEIEEVEVVEGEEEEVIAKPVQPRPNRLAAHLEKGKQILAQAQEKIKEGEEEKEKLAKNREEMCTKLQGLADDAIEKLKISLKNKVEAVERITKSKEDKVIAKLNKLQEALDKAQEAVEQIETKQEEGEALLEDEMKQAQASVEILKDQIHTAEQGESQLHEGDSVRLKMDPAQLKPKMLNKDLDHSTVGYIHHTDGKGGCAAIFSTDARWVGKLDLLERSPVKHNLPVVGDRVRVKATVDEPFFKWGSADRSSVGILKEVTNAGPPEGREVKIDFPKVPKWKGLFEEIEKAPAEAMKVGDLVWVAKDVSEPTRGWAGVTANSIGTLLAVAGDEVLVHFPECEKWQGLLSEIEHTRSIIAGDKVRVKKSVKEPKTGWAGISHDDEGVVKTIKENSEYGEVAAIDFPNRSLLWHCPCSELEIVSRTIGGGGSSKGGGRAGSPVQVDMDHVMEATQRMTQRVLGDIAEQQCRTQ